MAIEDWSPTLKTNLATISGIEQVHNYDEIPNTIMVSPSMMILPQLGATMHKAGGPNITVHQVILALYTTAQLTAESFGLLVPFIALVRDNIAANLMLGGLTWGGDVGGGGGHIDHVLPVNPPDNWYEGPDNFSFFDKLYAGIIFRIEVKEKEAVTVTV
jgi:hypothetical protein